MWLELHTRSHKFPWGVSRMGLIIAGIPEFTRALSHTSAVLDWVLASCQDIWAGGWVWPWVKLQVVNSAVKHGRLDVHGSWRDISVLAACQSLSPGSLDTTGPFPWLVSILRPANGHEKSKPLHLIPANDIRGKSDQLCVPLYSHGVFRSSVLKM